MSDEELERRLRAAMDDRAASVDPHLSGPELRRRAAMRNRPTERLRRAAPVLASAAAVAGIAVSVALVAQGGDDPARTPIQPGGGRTDTSVSVPVVVPTPSSTPRPSTSTRRSDSVVVPVRPDPSRGSVSARPTRTPESSIVIVPSRVRSGSPSGRATPPTRITVPVRPTSSAPR